MARFPVDTSHVVLACDLGGETMPHRWAIRMGVTIVSLYLLSHPVTAWGQFQFLGGVVADGPSCTGTGDGAGQVACGVRGTDSALYAVRFDPGTNFRTGFQFHDGALIGPPSCTGAGSGLAACGVRGTDSALYGIRFNPETRFSTGFVSVGGVLAGPPSCAGVGIERAVCGVKGVDAALYGISLMP
jgi:hypothetical protein